MMVISIAAIVGAIVVRRHLVHRFGEWNATLLVGGGYIVAVLLCYLLLPGINEVPQQAVPGVVDAVTDAGVTFPPSVLWNFRIVSLGIQAIMWGTIALAFGPLAQRLLNDSQASSPHPAIAR
jgi:hypothetical protein